MELSVCIITKNEKNKLEQCLKALKGLDVEIVVVDTGSTDGTKEMAAGYTDRIFDFAWQDDFSLARNYAAEKASYDMIMVLDSDEYVRQMNLASLEKMIKNNAGKVGRIRLINCLKRGTEEQEMSEWLSRIYDRRLYHYEGRIHEQITAVQGNHKEGQQAHKVFQTDVCVFHDGYSGSTEEMQKKIRRNITMLLKELEEEKDDPYLLYQLGKSYYVAGEYEDAIAAFDRVLCQDLNPKLDYVIDMIQAYGYSLLNAGRTEQALSLEGVYKEFGRTADFRFLMGLIYMNNGMFERAVKEFLHATEAETAYTAGADSYLAYYNAGVICECLGDLKRAEEYYGKCGSYQRARERLVSIKS